MLAQLLRWKEANGVPIKSFAYPYGGVSLPRKLQLQREFASCRGIYSGINSGRIDLGLLAAEGLYDRTFDHEVFNRRLDTLEKVNGWLILYTHDVAPVPSWIGCSPALLERAGYRRAE